MNLSVYACAGVFVCVHGNMCQCVYVPMCNVWVYVACVGVSVHLSVLVRL